MKVDFRNAALGTLSDLYNSTVSPRYRIDQDLFRAHTVDHPTFDWGASNIDPGEAFIAVKKSPNILYKGPGPDTAFVSLVGFKDPTVLLDLLKDVKNCLIDRGVEKLVFGSESGHFFPGCPIDCHQLSDFLSIAGFQSGSLAHDLERDLKDYEIPCAIPTGFTFRSVRPNDVDALEEFFEREFPGRWQYDTFEKIRAEGKTEFVIGVFSEGRCEGFALTQSDGCESQIGGAVWKSDLGKDWCSLGPIGVSKGIRGKGCGNALLGKGLEYLRDQGGRRCIIDWTGLVEFYGGHGFEVTRTYKSMSLDLDQYRAN